MTHRFSTRFRIVVLPAVLFLTVGLAWSAVSAPDGVGAQDTHTLYLPFAARQTGLILPADTELGGHSLEAAALRTAVFNVGLDPTTYPLGLPFTILNASGDKTFTVPNGTSFYVPLMWADDAPPVIGAFPSDRIGAQAYFFGHEQLGGHGFSIEVDGTLYPLGSAYLVGPLAMPQLPDGGTHYMVQAAFMGPLNSGPHTIVLRGEFSGAAVLEAMGSPYTMELTYNVTVE